MSFWYEESKEGKDSRNQWKTPCLTLKKRFYSPFSKLTSLFLGNFIYRSFFFLKKWQCSSFFPCYLHFKGQPRQRDALRYTLATYSLILVWLLKAWGFADFQKTNRFCFQWHSGFCFIRFLDRKVSL